MPAIAPTRPSLARPSAPALDLLQPLIEQAEKSSSLLCTRHPLETPAGKIRLPKFLYLGPRAGGTPIRVAVLAGLEAGCLASVEAVVRLLGSLRQQPPLARDYALFLYPLLDLAATAATLPQRLAAGEGSADAAFLRAELGKWTFDGIIALRAEPNPGFHAHVDSPILAEHVLAPALRSFPATSATLSTHRPALPWLAGTRRAQDGSRGAAPFEIELVAGGDHAAHDLAQATQEILRHYRRLLGHAPNL